MTVGTRNSRRRHVPGHLGGFDVKHANESCKAHGSTVGAWCADISHTIDFGSEKIGPLKMEKNGSDANGGGSHRVQTAGV